MAYLGQNIQRLRRKQRISQGELAEQLGLSVQAVSKWETGKANPDLLLLPRLAKLLGVTIDELFSGEEAEPAYAETLGQNLAGWDQVAKTAWKGTYLPEYGPFTPSEEALCLLGDVRGKKVLELACGGGESLLWMESRGAGELWGLDISQVRIEQARKLLKAHNVKARLFCDSMERNPGLPQGYFDIVYSVYGLGWSLDLDAAFDRAAEYLKPGGILVFSWDNPWMWCVEARQGEYLVKRSYVQEENIQMNKVGADLHIRNWKLSSYLNKLAERGFMLQRLVEESVFSPEEARTFQEGKYYSAGKACLFNPAIVVKARKI